MVTLDLSLRDLDDGALADLLAHTPPTASIVRVARNTVGPAAWEALQPHVARTLALDLGRSGLRPQDALRLADALPSLPALRALGLAGVALPPEVHRALADAPGSVRVWDLTATGLTEEALQGWCSGPRAHALEALSLGGNELGPWAGEALARLPGLRALALSCAPLGDQGAFALARGLSQASGLQTLRVPAAGVGPNGLRALLEAARGHPSLRVLDLGDHPAREALGGRENLARDLAPALAALLGEGALQVLALPDGALEDRPHALVEALREGATLTSLRGARRWPRDAERALLALLCAHASRSRRAPRDPWAPLGGAAPAVLWTQARTLAPDLQALGVSAQDLVVCERVLTALGRLHPTVQHRFAEVRSLAARMLRPGRPSTRQRPPRIPPETHPEVPLLSPPPPPLTEVHPPSPTPGRRRCFSCRAPYTDLHPQYPRHCPACAALNWERRQQTADLTGRVAVVTGARVKVGFAVALKLLRVGAVVHGVTRFPQDAADRFAREPDFARWRERLALHGLDLRQLPAVERFAERLAQEVSHLDVVVHNAAQTVQRPAGFFARELAREAAPAPEGTRGLVRSFLALAVPEAVDTTLFPAGTDDGFGQPVDLRERTSWNLRLEEVSTRELVEVQVINVLAPYVLTARWREALLRSPFPDRYVVNVSAVEGQFSRGYRSGRHPHTNMAKAALNMLTLTAAPALAREGIYLTAVDTGWVSDQNPWWVTERTVRGGFRLPLDLADAAARVLDPVLRGISQGDRVFGVFLKDYRPAPW